MNREQKEAAVKEIGEQLSGSSAVFAVDYRGISVPQAAELRGKLREADASFTIVKNRLVKRVTAETGTEVLDEHLIGPTALAYVHGDPVVAAKAITEFASEHDLLAYKGGIMEGGPLEPEQFRSIAKLPGRDVLHGQLVAMTAAPLTGVVRGLNALIQGLASQLGQIADQGLVSGEAPAAQEASEEAPGEEAEASAEAAAEEAPDEAPSEDAPETGADGGDGDAPTDEAGAEGEGAPEDEPHAGGEADVEPPAEQDDEATSEQADQTDQGDDAASDADETKED
jgi:large subunit ribosomal protein L10